MNTPEWSVSKAAMFTSLAEAVKRAPEQPAAEMEKVFEKEKRFQDAGWVGFSDMNNGKEGK